MPGTPSFDQRVIIILPKHRTQSNGSDTRYRRPRAITLLCSLLAIIAIIHFIAVTHSAYPGGAATTCQGWLRTADYTQIVHLNPRTQQMGAVQFVNQLVGGQPAVMVQVNGTDAQQTLDLYIFGCLQHKQQFSMKPLFTQQGLIQGSAEISSANTLITGELDTGQSAQNSALEEPLQQNIYREYKWQRETFVQVSFPSLYPVTSRSEAEAMQQQADSGQSLPWSDPLTTAEQMAKDILQWTGGDPQDMVVSKDGTTARVQLVQQSPQMTVIVTLERLIEQDSKGLWFVVGAQTSDFNLAQPQVGYRITPPFALKGTGALADGTITLAMFNHAFNPITFANTTVPYVDSSGNYTTTVSFALHQTNQEGLLLVESLPPNNSSEAGQLLLLKLILG